MKYKSPLRLRSVRSALARVVKAQLKLAVKIDALNSQFKDLLELRTVLERQLPLGVTPPEEQPIAYIRGAPAFASPNIVPNHHEQPQVGLLDTNDERGQHMQHRIIASHEVEHVGTLSTNDAQGQRTKHTIIESHEVKQVSGIHAAEAGPAKTDTNGEYDDSAQAQKKVSPGPGRQVSGSGANVQAQRPLDQTQNPSRKAGWPLGLSRVKTPCPHSPIPHRHRKGEGTELTCVNITYPEKVAAPS